MNGIWACEEDLNNYLQQSDLEVRESMTNVSNQFVFRTPNTEADEIKINREQRLQADIQYLSQCKVKNTNFSFFLIIFNKKKERLEESLQQANHEIGVKHMKERELERNYREQKMRWESEKEELKKTINTLQQRDSQCQVYIYIQRLFILF